MANHNGQQILQALEDLNEPATIAKITNHIAEAAGVRPEDLKNCVKKTLQAGLRYGFIQRENRKYFVASKDMDALNDSEAVSELDTLSESGEKVTDEMEDKTHKRRRRSVGHKRRRGSRSRSSGSRSSGSRSRGSRRRRRSARSTS